MNMKPHALVDLNTSPSQCFRHVVNPCGPLPTFQDIGDKFELVAGEHVAVADNPSIWDNLLTSVAGLPASSVSIKDDFVACASRHHISNHFRVYTNGRAEFKLNIESLSVLRSILRWDCLSLLP